MIMKNSIRGIRESLSLSKDSNEQKYHLLQISPNPSDNEGDSSDERNNNNNNNTNNNQQTNKLRCKINSGKGWHEFFIWRLRYQLALLVLISILLYLNIVTRQWQSEYFQLDTNNDRELTYTSPSSLLTTTILNSIENVTQFNISSFKNNDEKLAALKPPLGYLVWSDKCKIPNIDPYEPEIMALFKRQKYEPCTTATPLTNFQFNETSKRYHLVFDNILIKDYVKNNKINCCYHNIVRLNNGDSSIHLEKCVPFQINDELPINTNNIIVKCINNKNSTYINGHPLIAERNDVRERIKSIKTKQNSNKLISGLMVGIDSISRTNLRRAMTKTAQYLYDNGWFEMSGYNKMGDNTFPNLMAALTGYNLSAGYDLCKPKTKEGMDNCPIIWKRYQDYGYVTSYAEDETSISTFNYIKKGFSKPPVDYYLRPFLIQAEESLPIKKKSGLTFCLGYKHSADYVYDYAVELLKRYKDDPYFGFYWANTFSHNSLSDCTSMDDKILNYLQTFGKQNVYDKSIVIFFSDHGMRFGSTRKYLSGQLEERLPFLFISLPSWFKKANPKIVKSLIINENRLTNPYDLYMTLQHILQLSGSNITITPADGCPNCQSLFNTVPFSRSCEEIGINDHWCTCIPYQAYDTESKHIQNITHMIIDHLNDIVQNYNNGNFSKLCAKHTIKSIQSAYLSVFSTDDIYGKTKDFDNYKIVFNTKPSDAMFEATVRYFSIKKTIEVIGSISRLDSYAKDSKCIKEIDLQKYCSCLKT